MKEKQIPVFEEWPFKVPSVKACLVKIQKATAMLKAAVDGPSALRAYKKHVKDSDAFQNEMTHVFVLFTLDSANPKYAKAMDKMNEGMPLIQAEENKFTLAMRQSPHRAYLEKKLGTQYVTMG